MKRESNPRTIRIKDSDYLEIVKYADARGIKKQYIFGDIITLGWIAYQDKNKK